MVFKAMRLEAITREDYVEIEENQGLSPGGCNKSLGRTGETN